jgi:outer membrane protein insertion porin family
MNLGWDHRKQDRQAVHRKLHREAANGLRVLFVLTLLCGAAMAQAQRPPNTAPVAPVVVDRPAVAPPIVVAVRIVTEDGRVLSESPSGLSIEIGKPLDPRRVAESLRALYRTGDYADLRAESTAVAGGVRLDFMARENLFVNQVLIQGLTAPPSDPSAAAAMQLSLGQTYRRGFVDEALLRLREVLREEGLYTAEVAVETKTHTDTHQMDILVHVKPGPRARVGVIGLKNGTEYGDAELLSAFKLKSGHEITTARIQRGTDRIRKFLVKRGHLSARAVVRRGEYDPAKNSVAFELEITEGPRVQVTVTGAKFSGGDLKKLIPIYQEGAVDTDLLEEGKRNLRERMEREGYFDASIDYNTNTHEVKAHKSGRQGTEQVITYRIERGERHKLLGIEITGNHYFDTELLRSRLQVLPGAFAARGRFSRRLLESDAQSMRNLYLANGFLDAKVAGQALDDYRGKTGDVFIKFAVQEGKQTLVSSLSLEGAGAVGQDELRSVVGSLPGQPYSDFNVATDRDNILALYFNEGFPGARFTATSERVSPTQSAAFTADPKQSAAKKGNGAKLEKDAKPEIQRAEPVRLIYHIVEGPQTRVRRVLMTGYKHTRPGVIRREIRVKPDAPLREGNVVESQQRLYNLGIFNRVTIEPQNSAGTDPDKDVVVLVEEAKRYTIAYGGGFEVQRLASTTDPTGGQFQAAPRGIFEVSKLNLTGRADTLSLKLRGSTLQGRALLAYAAPNAFADPHLSLQATGYADKTRDISTFSETRYEGSLQLTDQLTSRTSALYRYTFRKVLVSNLNIPSQEIPLFNQPTLVSQFGMTMFRDSRNNPADPSRGSFNSADLSVADTSVGSSASFLRFFFQNSTYHPITRAFSFARSARLGVLVPYHDTVSLSFPAPTTLPLPTVIPLPERFFAGGGTSLRGFALNQAGPRDAITGFPVGGQALLVLNQEFRFPMRLPFVGTQLGGAFFYDGGNVFSRASRISFRSSPPAPVFTLAYPNKQPGLFNPTQCKFNCSNELNYFAHTVGFGLRYTTPVGPIRIDLGYQINPPVFVIPCKNGAVLCQQGTRLPRLQIFFNLGSSF